jgi:hypothetical protein
MGYENHVNSPMDRCPDSKAPKLHGFGGDSTDDIERSQSLLQWIGLRENLQETIEFPIEYGAFL